MEKPQLDDQKTAARFERVESYLVAHPALFATQGTVAASWRVYRGRRLGPYFRVAYRDRGRQRSIYLGRCEKLARLVRGLLDHLQRRRRRLRERQAIKRVQARIRASLRRWKVRLRQDLAAWGIQLKGFEFRGAARALKKRGIHRVFRPGPPPRRWGVRGDGPAAIPILPGLGPGMRC